MLRREREPVDVLLARFEAARRSSLDQLSELGLSADDLGRRGIVEFVLFHYLAPRKENIARRIRLLNANSLLNVVVGVVLLIAGA
jgi:hypothetical protein